MIALADVRAAAGRIAGRVLHTPALPCDVISRATGGPLGSADITAGLGLRLRFAVFFALFAMLSPCGVSGCRRMVPGGAG